MAQGGGSVKSCERERFADLLASHQHLVFLYALSLLHNAADAEEVRQETSLVMWRKFDDYQPGSNFTAWACRIAYFEVLRLRQRKASEERLLSNEFIELLAAETEKSMSLFDARREALVRCLGNLSNSDRELIIRRYQNGESTRSVADDLGRSVQGTRRALHRIRTALLGCIERRLAREEGV